MVTHECDTCHGEGEVPAIVPGHTSEPVEDMIDCPDCDGYGSYQTPDTFERLVGPDRAARIRRPLRRTRRRVEWARARWAERDAMTVAAITNVHKDTLYDEPRLRSVIDNDLMHQLESVTPLGWRRADLRWCRENAVRALRGQPMLAFPYEDLTDVRATTAHADFMERNLVAIVAERHRRRRA